MQTLILAVPAPKENAPADGPGGGLSGFLPLLLVLVVVMLFMPLFSRKERTRQKRLQGLKKHDRVVTAGGLYGTVVAFDDATATIEVAKGVRLTFKRSSIHDIEKQDESAPQEPAEKPSGTKG